MTTRALGLVLVLTLAAGCERGPDPAPAQVPAAWREVRESPNHRVHLAAGVACADCHRDPDYAVVVIAACARCHTTRPEGIHAMAALTVTSTVRVTDAACTPCHAFRGRAPLPTPPCLSCHAVPQGAIPPISGHTEVTCLACHGPHREKALDPARCAGCHTDRAVAHGRTPDACGHCHGPHDAKGTAQSSCVGCHARQEPVVTRMIPGHSGCLDCHRPHDVERAGLVPCGDCHAAIVEKMGGPAATSNRFGHGCVGCHPPHGELSSAGALPRRPAPVAGPVAAPAHAERLGASAPRPCARCHVAEAPRGFAHAPGAACRDCHTPHAPRLQVEKLDCRRCHQVDEVPGHAACLTCHVDAAHAPRPEPMRCADCHGAIAARAPAGHQACTSCHQTHGKVRPEASCASCHTAKVESLHGQLEGGCRTCHGPHPESPPPGCITCHARTELGGLHAVSEHATCTSCHRSHQPPPADRATCLSCHASKSTHYPEAKRCAACHAFVAASPAPAAGPDRAGERLR